MIVLLTDFGGSEYVGIMKGVIHSLHPEAKIVDLTHDIPPQSVREGAWVLLKSYKHFPKDTIFVCVVDPSVGSTRDAIVVQTTNYTFIGPDNGLMYPAVRDDVVKNVSSIIIPSDSSNTFHGRDVFARMAGYILQGEAGKMLGGFKRRLGVTIGLAPDGRKGEIVRIDKFGNIITNLPPLSKNRYQLATEDLKWELEWYANYSSGPESGVFLVTSSYDTLELTIKNASANEELHMSVGERVTIE
ncbi:MAG: SAM hydrolase/SAM-dependent halogenase family protein [Candidatus Thorarchaeota archaeon]